MSRRSPLSSLLLLLFGTLTLAIPAAIAIAADEPAAPATPAEGTDIDYPVGARFANGIAAIVESRIITAGDIRRDIQPVLPNIMNSARSQAEMKKMIEQYEDEIIQNLVDQVLIVKDFYSDEKRKGGIPQHYVDAELKEQMVERFDNDRSKYLAYLKSIGKTEKEYRLIIEEDIIVRYMRGQKQKSATIVSPQKIEEFYIKNRDRFYEPDMINLRVIKLSQIANENQAILNQTAETIMQKLRDGAEFAALATEYSQDPSKKRGGSMGWLPRSDLREELASAGFALEKGQYSEPLQIGKDIYIVFVEDKKLAGIQPLEEIREQIEGIIATQMAREARDRWLERLRRDAYVRYFN